MASTKQAGNIIRSERVAAYWEALAANDSRVAWADLAPVEQQHVLRVWDERETHLEAARERLRARAAEPTPTLKQLCAEFIAAYDVTGTDAYPARADTWRRTCALASAGLLAQFDSLTTDGRRAVAEGAEPVYTVASGDRPAGFTVGPAVARVKQLPDGSLEVAGVKTPATLSTGEPRAWSLAEQAVAKAGALGWAAPQLKVGGDTTAGEVKQDLQQRVDGFVREGLLTAPVTHGHAIVSQSFVATIGAMVASDVLGRAVASVQREGELVLSGETRLSAADARLDETAAALAALLKPLHGAERASVLAGLGTTAREAVERVLGEEGRLVTSEGGEGAAEPCPCRGCVLGREGSR